MTPFPLKRLARIRVSNVDKKSADSELPVRLCNYTDVYYRDEILPDQEFMRATATPEQVAAFRLRPGDVIITKDSETAEDIGVPTYVRATASDIVCGYHLAIIRPELQKLDGRFLYWFMSSTTAREQLAVAATGVTRFGLRAESAGAVCVPSWSLIQQRAIADYLDTETARIDALIARKQALVARLIERFESCVFNSVTLGLRNATLTASGLSWSPRIPEGWGTPTISANFDVQLGKMLSADAMAGPEQNFYLRNLNVQWDRIDLDDLATMHFGESDRRRFALKRGDLLVCEGGEVGRAAVWNFDDHHVFYQKALHRIRSRATANTRFLMYALRGAAKVNVFTVEGNLSTIVHLTREQLSAHRLPWPPEDEQAEIVAHLDRAARLQSDLSSRLQGQIRLLHEHRNALITAAVTGALEIMGVAE